MTFVQLREQSPTLSCECGHPASSHSLNIEFHVCMAHYCDCRGFSLPSCEPAVLPPALYFMKDHSYNQSR